MPHLVFEDSPSQPIDFLRLCEKNEFCINAVSESLNVPIEKLRKAFVAYSGMSPKKWMIQNRVLFAMRALREGKEMPEVIRQFGYYDQPHLGKDFKAILGEPPRSVRNRLRRSQESLSS